MRNAAGLGAGLGGGLAWDARLGHGLARLLCSTAVTPNQLTLFGLGVGLAGAGLLLFGDYRYSLGGMLLFVTRGILDHADGELARLKDCCSEFGYRLDYFCDTFSLPCLMLAAGWGQATLSVPYALPLGIVAAISTGTVYLQIFFLEARLGKEVTRPRWRDRYEGEDLIYLLPGFALLDVMPLFLWLSAIVTSLMALVFVWVMWRVARRTRTV